MGDKGEEEQGKPFQKGGEDSLWDGPVKKRCCTDIICIPIFFAFIVGFWILTFINADTGDPMKLIVPRDFRGNYCGIGPDGQWNSSADLTNFKKLMWAMNLDETFDIVAKDMACSQTGYTYTVTLGGMDKADWGKYCGKPVDAMEALQDAAKAAENLANDISNKVDQYSDPAKAAELFAKGPQSFGTSILKEMTKYSVMVCATTCSLGQDSVDPNRKYTYSPPPNKIWGGDKNYPALKLWTKFMAEVESRTPDMLRPLRLEAWPTSKCPYEDKYCIPTPGIHFIEVSNWNYCHPEVDSGVLDTVGSATGDGLKALGKLSVTEDAKRTFGDVIGDILKTWDVFIIVAVLSLVLGVAMLVLMRFILWWVVWISLILVFLILVGGGFAIFARANQCADSGFEEATSSLADSVAANTGGGANPFDVECAGGYSIESEDARTWTKVCGYLVFGIAALWLFAVICMICRIELAIAINKVACQFVAANPQVILVPIIQNIIAVIWIIVWVYCASFLLSQVTEDVVPADTYATYAEAYGTADDAGKCTDMWPAGDVYLDESASTCKVDYAGGPLCYRCAPPRYWFDYKFGYSFLAFWWHNFFFVAVGQCTIAGAVGIWFFTPAGQKWKRATVCQSLRNALFYHTGSLAFGSLILAIIVWLKWFMTWLAQQAKQTKNKVMECICKCLAYCLWCFEKCVKFLNKNAYIQIALMGTNFCTSAKNAFFLILRNIARFGVIVALSHIVHFITMCLIVAATAVCGYFILGAMYPDVNPVAPTICYGIIGWMAAKLFVGTFALAVDATLQAFIAAEEMDKGNDFAPGPLKAFINEKEGTEPRCCDGCCCTVM